MGLNVSDDDIRYLIKKYDTTLSGEISYEDFVDIFEGTY
jgi:Ca2+-binding EF-hand superfamily protein